MTQSTTAALIARKTAAVARGVGTRGIYATRAENSLLWDAEACFGMPRVAALSTLPQASPSTIPATATRA